MVEFHCAGNQINGDTEAVPLKRYNQFIQLQNVVEHILVDVKKLITQLEDNQSKL